LRIVLGAALVRAKLGQKPAVKTVLTLSRQNGQMTTKTQSPSSARSFQYVRISAWKPPHIPATNSHPQPVKNKKTADSVEKA